MKKKFLSFVMSIMFCMLFISTVGATEDEKPRETESETETNLEYSITDTIKGRYFYLGDFNMYNEKCGFDEIEGKAVSGNLDALAGTHTNSVYVDGEVEIFSTKKGSETGYAVLSSEKLVFECDKEYFEVHETSFDTSKAYKSLKGEDKDSVSYRYTVEFLKESSERLPFVVRNKDGEELASYNIMIHPKKLDTLKYNIPYEDFKVGDGAYIYNPIPIESIELEDGTTLELTGKSQLYFNQYIMLIPDTTNRVFVEAWLFTEKDGMVENAKKNIDKILFMYSESSKEDWVSENGLWAMTECWYPELEGVYYKAMKAGETELVGFCNLFRNDELPKIKVSVRDVNENDKYSYCYDSLYTGKIEKLELKLNSKAYSSLYGSMGYITAEGDNELFLKGDNVTKESVATVKKADASIVTDEVKSNINRALKDRKLYGFSVLELEVTNEKTVIDSGSLDIITQIPTGLAEQEDSIYQVVSFYNGKVSVIDSRINEAGYIEFSSKNPLAKYIILTTVKKEITNTNRKINPFIPAGIAGVAVVAAIVLAVTKKKNEKTE